MSRPCVVPPLPASPSTTSSFCPPPFSPPSFPSFALTLFLSWCATPRIVATIKDTLSVRAARTSPALDTIPPRHSLGRNRAQSKRDVGLASPGGVADFGAVFPDERVHRLKMVIENVVFPCCLLPVWVERCMAGGRDSALSPSHPSHSLRTWMRTSWPESTPAVAASTATTPPIPHPRLRPSDTLLSTAATDTLDLPKTPQGPAVSEAAAKPVMTTRRPPCWCMRVRMYGGISKGGAKGRMPLPGVSMGLGYLGNGSGANESFSSACGKHRAVLPPRALPTGAHHQILILGPALRNSDAHLRLGRAWPSCPRERRQRGAHHQILILGPALRNASPRSAISCPNPARKIMCRYLRVFCYCAWDLFGHTAHRSITAGTRTTPSPAPQMSDAHLRLGRAWPSCPRERRQRGAHHQILILGPRPAECKSRSAISCPNPAEKIMCRYLRVFCYCAWDLFGHTAHRSITAGTRTTPSPAPQMSDAHLRLGRAWPSWPRERRQRGRIIKFGSWVPPYGMYLRVFCYCAWDLFGHTAHRSITAGTRTTPSPAPQMSDAHLRLGRAWPSCPRRASSTGGASPDFDLGSRPAECTLRVFCYCAWDLFGHTAHRSITAGTRTTPSPAPQMSDAHLRLGRAWPSCPRERRQRGAHHQILILGPALQNASTLGCSATAPGTCLAIPPTRSITAGTRTTPSPAPQMSDAHLRLGRAWPSWPRERRQRGRIIKFGSWVPPYGM
ncbi:hypothetical protein B0H14DRAFT_3603515 [Mycena olivaceomarginata]|nr:hypothetical protein B0H14DRAFT_3603515 [Mycena olivaceomarginata]